MKRVIAVAALSLCILFWALAGGQPLKDAPTVLQLASGKKIRVLSIVKTTLHGSDEEALVLQYTTDISISNTEKLYREVEEVWAAFRLLVEKEKLHAAVVTANESASGLFSFSKGAGWAWKQRPDGTWHEPDAGDTARVPK